MKKLISLFAVLFLVISVQAQVIVRGDGKFENPTVVFQGVPGDSLLSKYVMSDLINCGWFKVIRSGKSDFIVKGRLYGTTLVLDVTNGSGAPMYSVRVVADDQRRLSQTAVDALLKKAFGVDGICRTKIVFSAETNRNQREIYMCDFDGRNIRRITANATLSIEPSWAPDGKSIIYNQYRLSSTPLVQYDLVKNRSRALSQHRGINSGRISPDWSQDNKIAYSAKLGSYVLKVVDLSKTMGYPPPKNRGNSMIADSKAPVVSGESPSWAPDNRHVVVSSRGSIYIVDTWTNQSRRLIGGRSKCSGARWSKILF